MSAAATAKPKEHGAWGVGWVSLRVGLLASAGNGAESVPYLAARSVESSKTIER